VIADDQDPFGHIMNAGFGHFTTACSVRFFESFEEQLGEKIDDLTRARGIGVMAKAVTTDMKRPVSYPDAVGGGGATGVGIPQLTRLPAHCRCATARGQD
jgi:acyl-CoA thioesterase FadM